MAASRIEIDHLLLRIPGLTRQEAHRLGRDVAEGLSQRLPPQAGPLNLSAMELRLSVPPGTPKSRLAGLVVDEILRRI